MFASGWNKTYIFCFFMWFTNVILSNVYSVGVCSCKQTLHPYIYVGRAYWTEVSHFLFVVQDEARYGALRVTFEDNLTIYTENDKESQRKVVK